MKKLNVCLDIADIPDDFPASLSKKGKPPSSLRAPAAAAQHHQGSCEGNTQRTAGLGFPWGCPSEHPSASSRTSQLSIPGSRSHTGPFCRSATLSRLKSRVFPFGLCGEGQILRNIMKFHFCFFWASYFVDGKFQTALGSCLLCKSPSQAKRSMEDPGHNVRLKWPKEGQGTKDAAKAFKDLQIFFKSKTFKTFKSSARSWTVRYPRHLHRED